MRYLAFDMEATGLDSDCQIIELAFLPFDSQTRSIETGLKLHTYIKCPPFNLIKDNLNEWVRDNMKEVIEIAHTKGDEINVYKNKFVDYLNRPEFKNYFKQERPILFGKSLNAIDLPFLNRDLGFEFMRDRFSHRTHDLTSVTLMMIDQGHLPDRCVSGSELMKFLNLGTVPHTALEDTQLTIEAYFKLLDISIQNSSQR